MRALALIGAALLYTQFASADNAGDAKSKQAMDAMHQIDANKDGQVSKNEYMKFHEQKFDAMDQDKNKMLTQDEWLRRQLSQSDGGF